MKPNPEHITLLIEFFNSNFFIALVTIITGLLVYLIFLRQKEDEREKAARIVWIEIIDCESMFDSVRSAGALNLSNIRQLPFIDGWDKYKHILAKSLTEQDLKLIDGFYATCKLLNRELSEAYSLPDFWREKGRIIAEKHIEYSEQSNSQEEYEVKKKQIEFFEQDSYWWQPFDPPKSIMKRIEMLQYVTNTPTGDRLRQIAKL